jgi:hypothetical protein
VIRDCTFSPIFYTKIQIATTADHLVAAAVDELIEKGCMTTMESRDPMNTVVASAKEALTGTAKTALRLHDLALFVGVVGLLRDNLRKKRGL